MEHSGSRGVNLKKKKSPSPRCTLLLSEEAETYLQDSYIVWHGDITFGIVYFMHFFFPSAQIIIIIIIVVVDNMWHDIWWRPSW
jgi:hypothetical protein